MTEHMQKTSTHDENVRTVLVLAATSDIARCNCRLFLRQGYRLLLAGRNETLLAELETELNAGSETPGRVRCLPYEATRDLADVAAAEIFWRQALAESQAAWDVPVDCVYIAQGFLPVSDARLWKSQAEITVHLNYASLVYLLEVVASWLETEAPPRAVKRWITVLTSVAGDRGRFSNYPYGAAKAGMNAYLSGLRARLFRRNVHVLTVEPGLVQTRMIAGREQAKSFLVARPEPVARMIDRAIRRQRNILYTPGVWWWILGFTRWIPECIFKRLRF